MDKNKKPSLILSIANGKCPRCRRGNMFSQKGVLPLKNFMKMPEKCSVCGQKMEPETGFYFGTGYVSYAISIGLLVTCFLGYNLFFNFSWKDNSIYKLLTFSISLLLLLQPFIMRLSRIIYLAIFVKYDEDWQNDAKGMR